MLAQQIYFNGTQISLNVDLFVTSSLPQAIMTQLVIRQIIRKSVLLTNITKRKNLLESFGA